MSELRVVVYRQRRVIGKTPGLEDSRLPRLGGNPWRGDLVVDAPSYVLRPRPAAVRPPGVLPRARVDSPEHVHPADPVEGLGEPGALLGEESGVLAVSAPVLEIDLLVRDVPVAAENELAAARPELFQHRREFFEKTEFRLLPHIGARPRGHVYGYHGKRPEIRPKEPSFGVELAAAETAGHAFGFRPRVQRDAAVALFRGAAIVVSPIPLRNEREVGEVGLLRLDLLHAHYIRILAREPLRESLCERRADAVEVERDNA